MLSNIITSRASTGSFAYVHAQARPLGLPLRIGISMRVASRSGLPDGACAGMRAEAKAGQVFQREDRSATSQCSPRQLAGRNVRKSEVGTSVLKR